MRFLGWALLCLALPAEAVELDRADDDSWVLEGGGFYKPYASWLVLPPDLVRSGTLLQDLLGETNALLPPETQLPVGGALPSQVGIATNTARLHARLTMADSVDIELAWQVAAIMTTSADFGVGSSQAGVLGTALVTAQRRLIDFDPFLVNDGGMTLQHNLDRLLLRWRTRRFTLEVGRQALSWGTGRLWNPTDLLSPFSPTDVDREVRRGADAVRLSLPLNEVSQLDVLWLPQPDLAGQGFVVRLRGNIWETDVSGTAAKYIDDLVLGADFAGDVGVVGVHGEIAWTLPVVGLEAAVAGTLPADTPVQVEGDFVRAVVGGEWRPAEALIVGLEYHYNGFGTDDPDRIVEKLRSDRVVRGEVFGAGRHYAGLLASWLVDDLLSVSGTAIVNLGDPGVLLVPAVEYWFEQRVLLRVGGFVPVAAGVDVELFRGLEPADVLTNSATFQRATTGFGARSEYGLSPAGAFVQVGAYFD